MSVGPVHTMVGKDEENVLNSYSKSGGSKAWDEHSSGKKLLKI